MSNQLVRVRFAPSPTGNLHIGSLRTALFNWLFARHYQGKFFIRIEDTDVQRSTKEFEQSLLESLAWSGITSDASIMYQSLRFDIYKKVAAQLIQDGKAYRCFCTEEELQMKRERAVMDQQTYQYDKKCRDLTSEFVSMIDKPFVVRFKVQIAEEQFVFDDVIKGNMVIPSEQIDDFVLLRSDGTVTYNFAVVVDDIEMKITHIIRGEEHLFNTPKQILLYQALQASIPIFAHIPLILGPTGQKLSKRDGATSVVDYKFEGFLPQALCNYLVRLGWSHGDQEIFSMEEMIQYFSLSGVHKSGAKFDMEKLLWINAQYLKSLNSNELIILFTTALNKDFIQNTPDWNDDKRQAWVMLYKDRVSTIRALYNSILSVYLLPVRYDWENLDQSIAKDCIIILQLLQQELINVSFDKNALNLKIKDFCKKHNYTMAQVSQLLRFILTGSISGPSVFEMMSLLGSKEVQKRILVVLENL